MTTPVTTQGPGIQGMSTYQQGQVPGFPQPLGIEQSLGQQYGWQQPGQQVTGAVVSQLLPIAYQVILPQVLVTAMQQIQACLQQIAGHLAVQYGQQLFGQQLFGQQGQQQPFGNLGYFGQQPLLVQQPFGQQGLGLYGRQHQWGM
jgi:hypothetical protein